MLRVVLWLEGEDIVCLVLNILILVLMLESADFRLCILSCRCLPFWCRLEPD